jgi:hypothetical protein
MAKLPEKPKKEHMSQRVLFIMGGVIWGLVLGPDIGLGVAKFVGGLNWPFIAGTRDWPEWADWVIFSSGAISGLTVFFTALIVGRNVGDRLEYAHDFKLRSGVAIPWAVIGVGVAVGAITVVTIEDRQQAVIDYVQEQKDAQARLLEFANITHRLRSARVDWPGNGEEGLISLSFRGKHSGNYLLIWNIWDASNAKEPLMEADLGLILSSGDRNTELALSPRALVTAWQRRVGSKGLNAKLSEDFTLKIRLIPEPTRAEWRKLPQHEPDNLADGKSILIDEVTTTFPVAFETRGGRVVWAAD